MDAQDLSYALVAALEDGDIELIDGDDKTIDVSHARTFADLNLLTRDEGFVVELATGRSFQITVTEVTPT
jgi:hypothetical protein